MPVFSPVRAATLLMLGLLPPAALALPAQAQPVAATATAPDRIAPAPISHARLLPLEGGRNFRDLGGYRTSDGHQVKWGMLLRSGSMHDLTAADFATLQKMGLRTVVDFRGTSERERQPVNWPGTSAPQIITDDYSAVNMGDVMQMLSTPGLDAAQAQVMMATLYREAPYHFASQYKRMFAELLAHHAPLAFNCSAGKDRTGIAAALILTALGVPKEVVMEDYLLSNRYYAQSGAASKPDKGRDALTKGLSPEVLKAMQGVHASYLEGALASITERSGSMEAYMRDELGLDAAAIGLLRALYLEPVPA